MNENQASGATNKKSLIRYWCGYFKSESQVRKYAEIFEVWVSLGWSCHLVLAQKPDRNEWLEEFVRMGVRIHYRSRPRSKFEGRFIKEVFSLCRNIRPNVLICDNIHDGVLIGATLARVPIRVWCKRAMNSHYEQCREPGFRERLAMTTRLSVMLATRVVAVSSAVGEELIELGANASKIAVINNPRPEIRKSSTSRQDVRLDLGIPDDALLLVAVGRLERVKGWDLLIDAFLEQAAQNPRAHLLLVGATAVNGHESFREDIDIKVEQSGVIDRIHMTGHVTDVRAMLEASDIFVLPSRSEGCCNALLEALAVGLPCVATKVGNAAEVLGDGRAGILVQRNDAKELGGAILRMLDDDTERMAMARQARIPETIVDASGWAHMIAELCNG